MRDKDDSLPGLLPDIEQGRMHAPPRERVEGGERLIHEQDFRLDGKCASDLEPLPHATGELRRNLVTMLRKIDRRQIFINDIRPRRFWNSPNAQCETHVLFDREPGKKRGAGILKKHHPIASGADDRIVVEGYITNAGRVETPHDFV